ncbi:MAG: regulatory protein RecX [Oscillospiraceae bacterium]|nr:regulatory protein RecX [Oscillospiraceae bacterium]
MNEEAKSRALRILEKRDVSRKMLIDKLTEKGISPEDAEDVADWLTELRVIDDERYAGLVVRHYAAKGYGPRRIREELYHRGVPREYWDTALEELPEQDDTLIRFIRSRLRGAEPTDENLRKIINALQRRGHSWEDIHAAVEHIRAEELE